MREAIEYDYEGIFVDCTECGNLHLPKPHSAFDKLVRTACSSIEASKLKLYKEFRIGEHDGRWDMNPDQGTFWFTHRDGTVAEASFGFVGTWIENTHSFKWAWDHPYTTPATESPAKRVLAYGKEHDCEALSSNLLMLNENEAWHMAAVTAHLSEYPLTYRAKVNDKAWLYFALSAPQWRPVQ
jgi:hypothetical protein